MTLTYGSLFTGVGGFDLGFDQAGYDCRWQVEWDKHCQQTLAYHWPNVPRHHDVCDVNGATLQAVDVITYGSPCQDLSVAGKRAGIEGGRSGMFFEAVRIFKEMRDATDGVFPRITVWENVPGALSSNRGADFRAVLTALDDIGALGQWWYVLDAQYFGVPQRRRRVFLVSVFDPAIVAQVGDGEVFSVGEGRRGNPSTRRKKGTVVAALTRTGVGTCSADDNQAQAGHIIRAAAFSAGNSSNSYGIAYTEDAIPPLRASASGTNQVPTVIAFSHTQGLDAQPSEVATPTLRSNGSGMAVAQTIEPLVFSLPPAVADNAIVRRLTPTECERLMGWPDDHTLHRADGKTNSDSTRYKMCGNGVATPVAKWIATNLRKVLDQ